MIDLYCIFSNIDWIAVSSISTFLSLIVLIFTLRAMHRSRVSSYRPKVFVQSKIIYLQPTELGFPLLWKDEPSDIYENVNLPKSMDYSFELINAGLGPAIGLEILFKIDKKQMLSLLEAYKLKFPDKIEINNQIITINTKKQMKENSSSIEYSCFQSEEVLMIKKVSLLPYTNHKSEMVNIPESILLFYSLIIYFETIDSERVKENIELPPIQLQINYKDIGDKKYKDKYLLIFEHREYRGGALHFKDEFIPNENIAALGMRIRKT